MRQGINQITTVSLFYFQGFTNKFWALRQMAFTPQKLKNISGLKFSKIMGSGANNGFGIRPNFGVYVLLLVWDSEDHAQSFFLKNDLFKNYCYHSIKNITHFLKNTMSHGFWNGQNPFTKTAEFELNHPVAVLTRATIRGKDILRFWSYVPAVSKALEAYKGLTAAIGIGELPLNYQATFSLWATGNDMLAYAYKGEHHKNIIDKTRKKDWYSEELFARFLPYREECY